jgi:hypothetical protein
MPLESGLSVYSAKRFAPLLSYGTRYDLLQGSAIWINNLFPGMRFDDTMRFDHHDES